MRYDPILREWVVVASNVNVRPVLGKTFTEDKEKKPYSCPFCPDAPEGAGNWVVKWVPNRFPSLVNDPNISFQNETIIDGFFKSRPGRGRCEVLLYTQDHKQTFGGLSISNIEALIDLWRDRLLDTMKDSELKYTFMFENRGEAIGVSLAHPHGQLYSFPFIPPKIKKMIDSASEYMVHNKRCLFCDILEVERKGDRIIEENADFIAFVPFFAKWPFEVHIYPKQHVPYISDIDKPKINNFARILKHVVKRLDGLFGFTMPYVLANMNAPINSGEVGYFHYHIEIYPPYRAKDRLKFLAGVELGTNAIINPVNPSDSAKQLRNVKIEE